MFSLELNSESNERESKAYFGGYNAFLIEKFGTKRVTGEDQDLKNKSDDGIFWMNNNSEDHWSVNLYGQYLVVDGKEVPFEAAATEVNIDSGASVIWIPQKEYVFITNQIKK